MVVLSPTVYITGTGGHATADCPAGKKAIGGGFSTVSGSVYASGAKADGSGWIVAALPGGRRRRSSPRRSVSPSPDVSAEREAGAHARPLPGRAVDLERAVERLDTVDEAAQSLAPGVGAAGAVVDDLDEQADVVAGGGDDDIPAPACFCTFASASATT